MDPSANKPGFFARLKQHQIYRVVVVYAVAAWILIQACNVVFPDFGLARGEVRVVIVVLLCGFPLTLVIAWMFIRPRDPTKYSHWQKLRWKLGAILSAAVLAAVIASGWSMWRYTARHPLGEAVSEQAVTTAVSDFHPPANSLAVLPFENLNADPNQQFFSDGITRELTDAIGFNPALQVIAWNTASSFRDSTLSPAEIGKQLNVAYLLYGSILHQNAEVRVAVELVNTVSGYQVWAIHYDRPFKDVLAVQDAISQAIAGALQVQFAHADLSGGTTNPEAHELVLQARALLNRTDAASYQAAQRDLEDALKLDPDYPEAHALLAGVTLGLTQVTTLPLRKALPKARQQAHTALSRDPRNVDALLALGITETMDNHPDQAREYYRQALALDPSSAAAHVNYALLLPLNQAVAHEQEALLLDPKNGFALSNLTVDSMDLGLYTKVPALALAMAQRDPKSIDSAFLLAFTYQQLHQPQAMVGAFDMVQPENPQAKQVVETGRLVYQSLVNPALHSQALAAVADLHHRHLSPDLQNQLLQLELALGNTETALRLLRTQCAQDPVGCDDLAFNPLYQPLRADARFQQLAAKYTTRTLN